MNARHSMSSSEWFTPSEYVEAAREVMGSIDLDPASCEEANRLVKATRYYTVEDDGLSQLWGGNVFLNPPGGRDAGGSLVDQFWLRLVQESFIAQAIWIGYSLEQLQTLQKCGMTPLNYPMCVPRKRIAFIKPDETKSSPSHANYITYLGPNVERFRQVFEQFGQVRI